MKIKYKRKRKSIDILLIAIVLLIVLITMSIGYSLWSNTLAMRGNVTASTNSVIDHVEVIPSGQEEEEFTISDISSSVLTITNQYTEGNIVHIEYLVYSFQGKPYTTNINFNFKNITDYTFLGGTSSYTVTGQTTTIDGSVVITMPTTINSQQTANLNIAVPLKFNKFTTYTDVTCTITYLINNMPKDFIVLLHFIKS